MMMKKNFLPLAATVAVSLSCLPRAFAQEPASIQGHANDEVGNSIKDGEIRLTQDVNVPLEKRKYPYTFKTDADGNYKGTGIAPGTYLVNLFRGTTSVDFLADQSFKAGEDKTENFDMTREEYLKQLTPERRKQIEEYKAKNAEANSANKQVANLNSTLTAVRADLKSPNPNFDKDVADAKATTTVKPDEPLLWVLYGDALTAKADHAAAEDRTNKVNPNTLRRLPPSSRKTRACSRPTPPPCSSTRTRTALLWMRQTRPSPPTPTAPLPTTSRHRSCYRRPPWTRPARFSRPRAASTPTRSTLNSLPMAPRPRA